MRPLPVGRQANAGEARPCIPLCKFTVNVTFAVNANRSIEEMAHETQRNVVAERDVVAFLPFVVKLRDGIDPLAKLLIRPNK